MNKKFCFILWGALFAICAAFGFIGQPDTALKILGNLFSIAFFSLGGFILWQARKAQDRATICLVRNLSLASMTLTAAMLVANFLSVFASQTLGDLLHYMLIMVSSPMLCAPSWAMSLFLWACLMVVSQKLLKEKSH